MSFVFFASYVYVMDRAEKGLSINEILFALAVYDVIYVAFLSLFGSYKKSNIVRYLESISFLSDDTYLINDEFMFDTKFNITCLCAEA